MTISCLKNLRPLRAYTLLEVLLALGLCAILALVSVPAMSGWWAEYQLRTKADQLVKLVQGAKLQAERSGQAERIVLLGPGQSEPETHDSNVLYFHEDEKSIWTLRPFANHKAKDSADIRIDSRGYVEPMTFRVTEGPRFIAYRFDFLTGHAGEEESSF